MSTDAVRMSQWPSDQRYVIPVAPGPDLVTVTIDGKEVQAPRGELLIKVAQEHGTYIPRFCWHERMKPVGMCRMCLVEVEGMRGMQISCATPVSDGMVVNTQSPNVKAVQDGVLEFLLINHPLDCPVCDRGGECPLAGPDPRVRPRRVALRRGEAPLREAGPDQRPRAARPRALHPVRPLHAVRGRDRRRPADRLRGAGRQHAGDHLPRRAVLLLLLRQHRADLPGRRAHRERVPVPRPSVGPADRRDVVHHVRGRVPRRAAEHVEPHRPPARRRLRAGQPGLALRQGPLRLRVGALRRARARADGAQERRAGRGVVARSARRRRRPGCRPRSTRAARRRSRCSAARGAPTRTPTSGPASPRACSAPTTSTRSSATACPPRSCSAFPAPPSPTSTAPAAVVLVAPDLARGAPGAAPARAPRRGRARRARHRARAACERAHARRHRGAAPRARRSRRDGRAVRPRARRRRHRVGQRIHREGGRARSTVATATSSSCSGASRSPSRRRRSCRRPPRSPRCPDVKFLSALAARQRARRARPRPHARASCPGESPSTPAASTYTDAWGSVPAARGLDAAGVLEAAAAGTVDTLVLLGAEPEEDFPDRIRMRAGLDAVTFVVAVGAFTDRRRRARRRVPPDLGVGREDREHHQPRGPGACAWRASSRPRARRWTTGASPQELAARFGAEFGLDTVEDVQDEIARVAPAHRRRRRRPAPRAPATAPCSRSPTSPTRSSSSTSLGVTTGRSWEPIQPGVAADESHLSSLGTGAVAASGTGADVTIKPGLATGDAPEDDAAAEAAVEPRSRSSRRAPRCTCGTASPPRRRPTPPDAYSLRLVAARTLYDAGRIVSSSPSLAAARRAESRSSCTRATSSASASAPRATTCASPAARGTITVPVLGRLRHRAGHRVHGVRAGGDVGPNDIVDIATSVTELRVETTR